MSSVIVSALSHYKVSANVIASMNYYFNTILFGIHFIYFKTTVLKLC